MSPEPERPPPVERAVAKPGAKTGPAPGPRPRTFLGTLASIVVGLVSTIYLLNPGAGAIVQAQLWYRDPVSTSNQTTSLSDAIEFCVSP